MSPPAEKKRARVTGMTYLNLISRASWKPLPAVVVVTGTAQFLKQSLVQRFTAELFGTSESPDVRRFQVPVGERQAAELPLATILDELRTPSFFSAHRVIVVDNAGTFLSQNADDLVPFVESGFSGGHLIAMVDGKLEKAPKLSKAVAEKGWLVECAQPYDRPPPWETRTPAWDSDLSRWVSSHAKEKGLEIDTKTAFLLHQRAGTDLAVLAEEIEKIATYLGSKKSRVVDAKVIDAVVGDIHENSVFTAVELFLEGRKAEVLEAVTRLFEKGATTERGIPNFDGTSIALLFIGALLPRLRALRRAHAIAAQGGGTDAWLQAGIVQKAFILRFQRQVAALPPRKLQSAIDRLYDLDKALKSGGVASRLLELYVVDPN